MLKVIFVAVLIAGLVLFLVIEARIFSHMRDKPAQSADFVIILGAMVNGTEPSLVLQQRVISVLDYLRDNHNTKVIACGGMGKGEAIIEAEAIKRLLLERGVSEDRVTMEQNSTSTFENLLFADEIAQVKDKKVVIATSEFHLCKALDTARYLEYIDVSGITSKTRTLILPKYLCREFFAIMRNYIVGYL